VELLYKYKIFKAGAIQPKGWILAQMKRDLNEGYIGVFDKVHPTVTHNLFVNPNRLSKRKFSFRKEWWSGEHEGYWKDAVVRMAFLTHDEKYRELAKSWIDEIIQNTGEKGYIGIYKDCDKPNCRFNHMRGNGELWATSRILMAMLAYFEFTGDKKVLDAIEKATELIISEYSDKNYFSKKSKGGGVSHGIGFFECLEWLYRITDKDKYLAFSKKLYRDFNLGRIRDDDLKTERLLDEDRLFEKHGAHIAEGLFVPEFISEIIDKNFYDKAAENVLYKLEQHLTPGGAMRCDEWIKGREGTADERYEYCGIAEMISPFNKIISFCGDLSYADYIETMTFNAGQGARFPVLSALSYLTSDNRIKINHRELIRRESYDAAHVAAVCCVLNGARLMPYFVEGMWMEDTENQGVVALLYGPNELETKIKNVQVKIVELTDYPFSDEIYFQIHPEKDIDFPITLRIPFGCSKVDIDAPSGTEIKEYKEKMVFRNSWKEGDRIKVDFNFKIRKIPQPPSKSVKDTGMYLKRGPLVYALPFAYDIDTVKEHGNSGFYRYRLHAKDTTDWNLKLDAQDDYKFKANNGKNLNYPWDEPIVGLEGKLINKKNEKEEVVLVPMGNTVFRRVTFSVKQ